MSNKPLAELPKAYQPQEVEQQIYQQWEESGYFNPDNCLKDSLIQSDSPVFSVMMPPPNVTGVLHLGHALENALLDTQTRFQRMQGARTLLLPGTDHAAVATQAKVEKMLMKEQGYKDPRQELGKEKLLKIIREYAEKSRATILTQIKKLGTSCDWSRLAYTFDDVRSRCVKEIFVKMYNDGLIYRGYRVVNWSVKGQCTCSDEELVYEDREAKLYFFKYSPDFPIEIATTRPETKLGDTAVAVNPNDSKYQKYIGQTFTVSVGAKKPLSIKIIADESVDPDFGTGALGVTPAHSAIDYDLYLKHNLELIPVIGEDGRMTEQAGPAYQGLTVMQAREKFVDWLQENGLLSKIENIGQSVGKSDRFQDVIEVIPKTQWFVAVNKKIPGKDKTFKELLKDALTVGHNNDPDQKINILPDRFNNTYFHWINNLRDWCISRQIWWGHPIPVWYCQNCQKIIVDKDSPKNCPHCQSADLIQDPDTLDTWFSSGTWTFSTLGWPDQTDDLKTYHPTSWMQMGYEILFFWMARMILMSAYALDQIPFKQVYIHGMLRDQQGRKFSKSLGNGIDPLDMINKYGADALRVSLIADTSPGQDSRFYEEKTEHYRNLMNKLWNISRFIFTKNSKITQQSSEPNANTLPDQWILQETNALIAIITKSLREYNFSMAVNMLAEFTWHKLADNYLELSKQIFDEQTEKVRLYVLQTLLKLWHPFAPFITEHIWQNFASSKMLLVTSWPQPSATEANLILLEDMSLLLNIGTRINNLRNQQKLKPRDKTAIIINTDKKIDFIKNHEDILQAKSNLEKIIYDRIPENTPKEVINDIEIALSLATTAATVSPAKKEKEIIALQKYIVDLENRLSNQEFLTQAPAKIIDQETKRLQNAKDKLEKLN